MKLEELFERAVKGLRRRGIPFAVAGGFAVDLYRREPRLTMNVDLAIGARSKHVASAKAILESLGLHAGIARAMQFFCGEYKTEHLLNMGLDTLNEIEQNWVPKLYAIDPHKLMRSLEDLSILTKAQIIIQASLARQASSSILDFHRIDFPEIDPPEWRKFITLKQENGKVRIGEKPLDYAGNLKENYEARNMDYEGVYKEK